MLVHKSTMGVVDRIWTGQYTILKRNGPAIKVPKYVEATFTTCNISVIERDKWWYVPSNSTLAKKILKVYPDCRPVTNDDDELIDITIGASADELGEFLSEINKRHKKTKTKKQRPTDVFPGLENFCGGMHIPEVE